MLYWDNGKENGNYDFGLKVCGLGFRGLRFPVKRQGAVLRLYWDNGKENGNYCLGFRI